MQKTEIVSRCVSIRSNNFVLVKIDKDNDIRYGTIPYAELNDKGELKRGLNGLDMCLSSSITGAIESRTCLLDCEGMTQKQIEAYFRKKWGLAYERA